MCFLVRLGETFQSVLFQHYYVHTCIVHVVIEPQDRHGINISFWIVSNEFEDISNEFEEIAVIHVL